MFTELKTKIAKRFLGLGNVEPSRLVIVFPRQELGKHGVRKSEVR